MQLISSMQAFQPVDVLTDGGTLKAAKRIVYWMYPFYRSYFEEKGSLRRGGGVK